MAVLDRKFRIFFAMLRRFPLCGTCAPIVRELYQRLSAVPYGGDKGWIDPWLDEELLLPAKIEDWKLRRLLKPNGDVRHVSKDVGHLRKYVRYLCRDIGHVFTLGLTQNTFEKVMI